MFFASYDGFPVILRRSSYRFTTGLPSLDDGTCRVSFICFLPLGSLFPLLSKNIHACARRPS
jgi:hypothetical protein